MRLFKLIFRKSEKFVGHCVGYFTLILLTKLRYGLHSGKGLALVVMGIHLPKQR